MEGSQKIALEISDDVYICSNGTLLSDKKLYELVHAGVKGIILSLQALDSELSSKIYGNSNVPKLVFSAIERIKKYDLSLGVEMTIMKYNIEIINDLVLELIKHNVNFISFKRLLPVGRGADENIRVSKEEQYEALNKIFSLQISNPNIRFNVHDPLYGTILYDNFSELTNNETVLNWIKSFSCRAGTRWLGIDPNGNVSPCPILLYKDLLIGNILDAPLVKILEESPLIKTFESLSKYKSNSCKYSSYCLGCRATAVSQTNCVDSKDPMCIHESEKCPINDLYRRS